MCIRTLTGHARYILSLVYLPDGLLASGSDDKTIKIWNIETGMCIKTLEGHEEWVRSLVYLPGGLLASGSADKTIKIWKV